jgi:hypothetical protein
MFSVSEMAGGDESIRAPETRHGRVGPERYWLDNDSAVKEAGPVEGRFTDLASVTGGSPEMSSAGRG